MLAQGGRFKLSVGERGFKICNYTFLALLGLLTHYPLLFLHDVLRRRIDTLLLDRKGGWPLQQLSCICDTDYFQCMDDDHNEDDDPVPSSGVGRCDADGWGELYKDLPTGHSTAIEGDVGGTGEVFGRRALERLVYGLILYNYQQAKTAANLSHD